MTNLRCLAFGIAIVLPLFVAGGQAHAFSYTDGPPGYGDGNSFADPDAQFDVMSDRMNQMYDSDTTDYSQMLTQQPDGGASAPAVSAPPRLPIDIGGNR